MTHHATAWRASAVAVLAALLGALAVTGGQPAHAAKAAAAPVGASIVGAHVTPVSGQTEKTAVQALESQLGTTIPIVSEYPAWNSAFPKSDDLWLRDTGHKLVLLIKLKKADGSRPKWADLANAQPGDPLYNDMLRWANSFKTYGAPLYVAFHKEPNEPANQVQGTPADYKAAWARLVTFMNQQGVTNVTWVYAMAAGVYAKLADTWYPGDQYVDIIASTGVGSCASNNCTYRQQRTIMAPLLTWAAANHPTKRIAVCESGTLENADDPTAKATWLSNAESDLKGPDYQKLEFIIYRHYQEYRLDTSANSLAAARTWFKDAYWRS